MVGSEVTCQCILVIWKDSEYSRRNLNVILGRFTNRAVAAFKVWTRILFGRTRTICTRVLVANRSDGIARSTKQTSLMLKCSTCVGIPLRVKLFNVSSFNIFELKLPSSSISVIVMYLTNKICLNTYNIDWTLWRANQQPFLINIQEESEQKRLLTC